MRCFKAHVALCCAATSGSLVTLWEGVPLIDVFVSSQIVHIEANALGNRCVMAGLLRYGVRCCGHGQMTSQVQREGARLLQLGAIQHGLLCVQKADCVLNNA